MIHPQTRSYAIRAIARLAVRPHGNTRLEELCEGTDLPKPFVVKVLRDLVRGGLITTSNGSHGGFALARQPSEMTICDIIKALDGVEDLGG